MSAMFAAFIARWTVAGRHPPIVAAADLAGAEMRLQFLTPAAYRDAILAHGAPSTSNALLGAIVDQDLDLNDVQDFFEPADLVKVTEDWRALGLPVHLVAFASDCAGNLFCFSTKGAGKERQDDSPVWFWNQEFAKARAAAPSFSTWIEGFCQIPRMRL